MVKSLKNKIAFIVLLLIVAMGAASSYYVARYTKTALISQKKEDLEMSTIQIANEISHLFDDANKLVSAVANNHRVVTYLEDASFRPQDQEMLELLSALNPSGQYAAVYLMTASGTTLVSTDERFVGNNYGFRRYFTNAVAGQTGVEMAIGATTKEPGYFFASRILSEDGRLLGVIAAKLNPEEIHQKMMAGSMNMSNHVHMLADQYGVILESSQAERRFSSLGQLSLAARKDIASDSRFAGIEIKPLSYEPLQQDIDKRISQSRIYEVFDDLDKERELLSLAPVHGYDFYVAMEIKELEFLGEVARIYSTASLLVLLVSLLTSAVVFLVLDRFLKPLGELKAAAKRLSLGDYGRPAEIKSGDELEELATSFNSMMVAVSNSFSEIDRKVREQTAEIKAKEKLLRKKEQENEQKIRELESWQKTTVDRELKMMELKKENNELRSKLGFKE